MPTKSGTSGYRAPEVYSKSHEHSFASDYFPLGIMLYQFWKTRKPFDKKSDFHKKLSSRKAVPEIDVSEALADPNLSPEYVDAMTGLLKLKPEERLGAKGGIDEILTHPFFGPLHALPEDDLLTFKRTAPWVPFDASLDNIYAEIDSGEIASLLATGSVNYSADMRARNEKDARTYNEEFKGYDFENMGDNVYGKTTRFQTGSLRQRPRQTPTLAPHP